MNVFLYNSTVCRLCGEENGHGTLLYSCEDNETNLCDLINKYLPLRVSDDGELPRTICPGCSIQLEATVEFLNLIIKGQKIIRELHAREKEYKKSLQKKLDTEVITENISYEINTSVGVFSVEHPISLEISGLDKPKRKRGRPPKKSKSAEAELALDKESSQDEYVATKYSSEVGEPSGKRKRKTPIRFKGAVQGKELERIFKEEGVIDAEESDAEVKPDIEADFRVPVSKEPEVIGHLERSGELVVVIKGKGRGRPKGRMRQTREECAICGMTFSCVGRYMSHVAQHGRVVYECAECSETFDTRLQFNEHQQQKSHTGQNIIQLDRGGQNNLPVKKETAASPDKELSPEVVDKPNITKTGIENEEVLAICDEEESKNNVNGLDDKAEISTAPASTESLINEEISVVDIDNTEAEPEATETIQMELPEEPKAKVTKEKAKLKCHICDKQFSNRQSKSMHIKATHSGERPYVCKECGAAFPYPRSLSIHAISHRKTNPSKGFACDLCGKVLNHPSSVVYHKEAEHAGHQYVCIKCGKGFKHKQLLQRHQLVHSQLRPFSCKICAASFKTKANLMNHQLLHTGVKKFSCEICKQRFAHKTSLTLHMRLHTGVKPFPCSVCGKRFSQKGNLSEHMRIHTGEKPYRCHLCPRVFTTSSQRRLHARRHGANNNSNAATFKRSSTRTTTSSNGTGGAGHRCAWCGRMLWSRAALARHLRRHAERPLKCPHCPRLCTDSISLAAHTKQAHKQMSLLATEKSPQEFIAQPLEDEEQEVTEVVLEEEAIDGQQEGESVIYVTYDVENEDAFQLLEDEQTEMTEIEPVKDVTSCSLYDGESLLMHESEQIQHMPVTDEEGNPLHFTMQDGTRLAITSTDGKSLQVITQDGQTIPVEINNYNDEISMEMEDSPEPVVHQLNGEKEDANRASPVAHYFTFV